MELPYFNFYVSDYLTGKIQKVPMETQGIFINICALWWKRQGKLFYDIDELSFDLRVDKQMLTNCLNLLIERGIIVKFASGLLDVCFLRKQLEKKTGISVKRSIAGAKGGKQMLSKCLANDFSQNQIQNIILAYIAFVVT